MSESKEDGLRTALEWYAEQVAACRKNTGEGYDARHALNADGGKRAQEALASPTAPRGVEVKPLEWKEGPTKTQRRALTGIPESYVAVPGGPFDEAAAQADFKQRIYAALSESSSPVISKSMRLAAEQILILYPSLPPLAAQLIKLVSQSSTTSQPTESQFQQGDGE